MENDDTTIEGGIDPTGLEQPGAMKELANLFDIKTKQLLDPMSILDSMQGFKASQKLLHQAEMLNPVSTVIILVNMRDELYVMSTESDPADVLHMVETAKKRLV